MNCSLKYLTIFLSFLVATSAEAASRRQLAPCLDPNGISCIGAPHVYETVFSRPSKGGTMYVDPWLFQLLDGACNLGGGVMSVGIAFGAGLATSGIAPIAVAGTCPLKELARMGLPPPKPMVINVPGKNVVYTIDWKDPAIRKQLEKVYPQLREPVPAQPAAPTTAKPDVPMAAKPDAQPAPQKTEAPAVAPTPTTPTAKPVVPRIINPSKETDQTAAK